MAKTKERRRPGRGRRKETEQATREIAAPVQVSEHVIAKEEEQLPTKSPTQMDLSEDFTTTISMHLEPQLFVNIEQMLDSLHMSNDYKWSSVADFVREALFEHSQGMNPVERPGGKRTKRFSIRANRTIERHWESLPKRKKAEILDRLLRTKLNALHN